MSNQTSSSEPSLVLPIAALVFFFVFWPIGFILSVVAIVKYQAARGTTARTLAIIAVVMNVFLAVPMCGIVAAIAVPNFVKFQCRSKQSEARGNLKGLYVSEEAYKAETDTYSTDPKVIQFAPKGTTLRYGYAITSANKDAFSAEARGTGDMEGDVWSINEKNELTNISNGCSR